MQKEQQWDKKLRIQTVGRIDDHADAYHYPYEPTPYCVLERLVESGYIGKENKLIDYGCGKGRVGFYLNHAVGCRTVGVEYNEGIYADASANLQSYGEQHGVSLVCANAEEHPVGDADCFYFFNPFSVRLFRTVLRRIMDSFYDSPRTMRLFFYYPNNEYMAYLMSVDELDLLDEIDCRDLFPGDDEREKILIFELKQYC